MADNTAEKNIQDEKLKRVNGGDNELPTNNCPECGHLTTGHYVECCARFICPICGNMWEI